jgi:hypothetical protein
MRTKAKVGHPEALDGKAARELGKLQRLEDARKDQIKHQRHAKELDDFECSVWRGPISVRAALRPSKRMRHWVTCESEGAISMNSSFSFGAQLKRIVEEAVLASQWATYIRIAKKLFG